MHSLLQNSLMGIGSLGLITGLNSSCDSMKPGTGPTRPNIIYILADDLGYGELGCFGQTDIETPNIDRLAAEGMIFTNHYSGSAVCAPARSVLLTGLHSGMTQVRSNDEMAERGDVWDYRVMLADSTMEGQRPLGAGTYTLGTLMQTAGYRTAIVGKWGLGAPHTAGVPNMMGFDLWYGYNCQRQAHTYYPVHLWKNNRRVYLNNDTIAPHAMLPPDADPYDPDSYADYNLNDFASTLMFDEIVQFIDENATNPFFLYWADPIPHLPFQAPQRWVDYYVDKFGDEEPYTGRATRGGYFPTRYPDATYAAMITYLDENVGKLVQQLKDLGIYENTLIIFTSDNGPTSRAAGRFGSAGPFNPRNVKGYLNEGGIRVPMIASWPGVISPGSQSDHISAFYDVMPTLAGIVDVVPPRNISGMSFLPTLMGEKQKQPEFLYWEFPGYGGQMAVRMGNLKALRQNMFNGNLEWKLFDLDNDPGELTDIAAQNPGVIARVEEIVARERTVSPNHLYRFSILGD